MTSAIVGHERRRMAERLVDGERLVAEVRRAADRLAEALEPARRLSRHLQEFRQLDATLATSRQRGERLDEVLGPIHELAKALDPLRLSPCAAGGNASIASAIGRQLLDARLSPSLDVR